MKKARQSNPKRNNPSFPLFSFFLAFLLTTAKMASASWWTDPAFENGSSSKKRGRGSGGASSSTSATDGEEFVPCPPAEFIDVPDALDVPAKIHRNAEVPNVFDVQCHKGMWSVAASSLTAEDCATHSEALTCRPNAHKSNTAFGPSTPFHIGGMSADGERLVMPPHYAAQAFPGSPITADSRTAGEPLSDAAVYTGTLWEFPPQIAAVATWKKWWDANDAAPCMLCLPCGHGKTNVVNAIVSLHIRRVTVVLVHKRPLVTQWADEIRKFVPGAKVGTVTPERQRVVGVDFIVASLQTLHSHMQAEDRYAKWPYLAVLESRVGCVVLDEAHHGVASTFQAVVAQLPARYRLAVTATPRRRDGLFKKLQFIFGPVVFRSFRQPGDGNVVMLKYINPEHKERTVRIAGGAKVVNKTAMETDLVTDRARDKIAVELVARMAISQQRRVVVITPRVDHVATLQEKLQARLAAYDAVLERTVVLEVPDEPPTKPRRPKNVSLQDHEAAWEATLQAWEDSGPHVTPTTLKAPVVGAVTSKMTQHERQLNYEATVVVATSNMLEEGISYKQWDTLIDLANLSDSEQIVGRILRAAIKKVPLVVDVWSPVSLWTGLRYMRQAYYKDEDMSIRHITASSVSDLPGEDWFECYNRSTRTA